jgi:hypothetical protein
MLDAWFVEHRHLIGNASYYTEQLIQAANVLTLATNAEVYCVARRVDHQRRC